MSEGSTYPVLLLVEDDRVLQTVLEIALSEEGFEIVTADSGAVAIKALEEDGARFDALVTDIRLGKGANGWEVARRGRELAPAIPVIYMSGDSGHEWSANGVPHSVMLQKPFVMAQLITAVTTLLNAAGNAAALTDRPEQQ